MTKRIKDDTFILLLLIQIRDKLGYGAYPVGYALYTLLAPVVKYILKKRIFYAKPVAIKVIRTVEVTIMLQFKKVDIK